MPHPSSRLVALMLGLAVAACAPAKDPGPHPIRLGFLAPLSGPDAEAGRATLAAAQLAADHVNQAGGVSGHQLEIMARDTRSLDDPQTALPLAAALAEEGVAALIVRGSSSARAVVTQVAKPRGIPVLTSGAGADLSKLDDGGLLFRTEPSDALFAKAIARILQDDRQPKVTLVARDGLQARELEPELRKELGKRFAGSVFYPDTDKPNAAQVLRLVPAGTKALVLVGGAPDQSTLFKAWQSDKQRKPFSWYFQTPQRNSALPYVVGAKGLEGFKGVSPLAATGPHFEAFRKAYKARTGQEPGDTSARAYDTVMMCALAMVMGGAGTPAAIQRNLVTISTDGAKQRGLGPDGVRDAISVIRSGTDLDYEGAAGAMDLDARGEVHGDYAVWVWRSGMPVDTGEVLTF